MDIFIFTLTILFIGIFIMFFLVWLIFPVNDDQDQAPAWVLYRLIKKLFRDN